MCTLDTTTQASSINKRNYSLFLYTAHWLTPSQYSLTPYDIVVNTLGGVRSTLQPYHYKVKPRVNNRG